MLFEHLQSNIEVAIWGIWFILCVIFNVVCSFYILLQYVVLCAVLELSL